MNGGKSMFAMPDVLLTTLQYLFNFQLNDPFLIKWLFFASMVNFWINMQLLVKFSILG